MKLCGTRRPATRTDAYTRTLVVTDRADDGTMCRAARRYASALKAVGVREVVTVFLIGSDAGVLEGEICLGATRVATSMSRLRNLLRGHTGPVFSLPQLVSMSIEILLRTQRDLHFTHFPIICHPPSLASHTDGWRQAVGIVRLTLGKSARPLAISPGTAEDAHRTIFRGRAPILTVPIPYEPPDELARDRTAIGRLEGMRIAWVGHHRPVKNPILALKVAALLRADGVNFQLVMLGGGPELSQSLTYVKEQDLEDYVYIAGRVDNVEPLLSDCDVLLCTSLEEGYGQMILEAMSLGNAIVSTPALGGGVQYLLGEGRFGSIAESFDPVELASHIKRLCEDPVLLSEQRTAARKRAREFSYSAVGAMLVRAARLSGSEGEKL